MVPNGMNIENLTEEEKAEMEHKAQDIRDTAFGLANAIENLYEKYGIEMFKEIIDYLDDRELEFEERWEGIK